MRVCHLSKYYPPAPGGIETHVQTLARAQRALGLDVEVLCLNHEHCSAPPEADNGVRVRRFQTAASFFELHYCPNLIGAIRAVRADVLHLQVPNPTMLVHAYLANPKVPVVVTYQSDVVRQRLRAALFRPIERRFYRRVARIVATSRQYANGSRFLQSYADRVTVLPMGLHLDPFLDPSPGHLAEAARIRTAFAGPLWLACGRLVYYKGLLTAVRALKNVVGTLIIIGDGPELDALRAEAHRQTVHDRIVFKGSMINRDIIPYYLAATAFWFPSNARSEAFGLAQVEAMAAGSPVINTTIPHSGVSWVSQHEMTGLTVPMNDPPALTRAARRLLDEPGLRDRLGAQARQRARQEFDHRTMARRSLDFYRRAMTGS
jgi:rhamnosyl/mannosyltransferase